MFTAQCSVLESARPARTPNTQQPAETSRPGDQEINQAPAPLPWRSLCPHETLAGTLPGLRVSRGATRLRAPYAVHHSWAHPVSAPGSQAATPAGSLAPEQMFAIKKENSGQEGRGRTDGRRGQDQAAGRRPSGLSPAPPTPRTWTLLLPPPGPHHTPADKLPSCLTSMMGQPAPGLRTEPGRGVRRPHKTPTPTSDKSPTRAERTEAASAPRLLGFWTG